MIIKEGATRSVVKLGSAIRGVLSGISGKRWGCLIKMTKFIGWFFIIVSCIWFGKMSFIEVDIAQIISNSAFLIAGAILARG